MQQARQGKARKGRVGQARVLNRNFTLKTKEVAASFSFCPPCFGLAAKRGGAGRQTSVRRKTDTEKGK